LYSSAGEPAFTHYTARAIDTVDYIFHSGDALVPVSVLSLPELDDIDGYNLQVVTLHSIIIVVMILLRLRTAVRAYSCV
jgi:mRNA deadenylase 3'-5' endonuclease subunit Ccr4